MLPQGGIGGHDQDTALWVAGHRQLQRRFDADDDALRVAFPQGVNGGGGGGIAGHHQGLGSTGKESLRVF